MSSTHLIIRRYLEGRATAADLDRLLTRTDLPAPLVQRLTAAAERLEIAEGERRAPAGNPRAVQRLKDALAAQPLPDQLPTWVTPDGRFIRPKDTDAEETTDTVENESHDVEFLALANLLGRYFQSMPRPQGTPRRLLDAIEAQNVPDADQLNLIVDEESDDDPMIIKPPAEYFERPNTLPDVKAASKEDDSENTADPSTNPDSDKP